MACNQLSAYHFVSHHLGFIVATYSITHSGVYADLFVCMCRHRRLAEQVAVSLAPGFVDATSSMYNNITDYILGPMHGHPYPTTTQRPLPPTPTDQLAGCWPDDSDQPPDGDSGSSHHLLVTEADNSSDDSLQGEDPSTVSQSSAALASDTTTLHSKPETQNSIASAASLHLSDNTAGCKNQADAAGLAVQQDRPSNQKGGASPQTHIHDKSYFTAPSVLRSRYLSTAQRHVIGGWGKK